MAGTGTGGTYTCSRCTRHAIYYRACRSLKKLWIGRKGCQTLEAQLAAVQIAANCFARQSIMVSAVLAPLIGSEIN